MRNFVDDWLNGRLEFYPKAQGQMGEQTVMNIKFLANDELQRRTLILPHCLQQSFKRSWQPGDFIVHATPMLPQFSPYGPHGKLIVIEKFSQSVAARNWSLVLPSRLPNEPFIFCEPR